MVDETAQEDDDYEYAPVRLSSAADTLAVQAQLTVAAEYGGWELARVRRYSDGRRAVTLRRRAPRGLLPGLSY